MMIGAEFGRKNHGLIFTITIGRKQKPLDDRTDSRTKLNYW
jgi:hypothetical protein